MQSDDDKKMTSTWEIDFDPFADGAPHYVTIGAIEKYLAQIRSLPLTCGMVTEFLCAKDVLDHFPKFEDWPIGYALLGKLIGTKDIPVRVMNFMHPGQWCITQDGIPVLTSNWNKRNEDNNANS